MKIVKKIVLGFILLIIIALLSFLAYNPKKYTISFETNGGSEIKQVTLKKGKVLEEPTVPFREGYIFEGWYKDASLTELYNFNDKVTDDLTLHAKWVKSYTVIFDSDGGTEIASQTIKENDKATRPDDPEKDGYIFVKWELKNKEYNFDSKVVEDITLLAVWSKDAPLKFTVKFNTNKGSAIASQKVLKNETVSKPKDPTRNGYTFAGWYIDSKLTKKFNFSTKITKNITLYAKWIANTTTTTQTEKEYKLSLATIDGDIYTPTRQLIITENGINITSSFSAIYSKGVQVLVLNDFNRFSGNGEVLQGYLNTNELTAKLKNSDTIVKLIVQ